MVDYRYVRDSGQKNCLTKHSGTTFLAGDLAIDAKLKTE